MAETGQSGLDGARDQNCRIQGDHICRTLTLWTFVTGEARGAESATQLARPRT